MHYVIIIVIIVFICTCYLLYFEIVIQLFGYLATSVKCNSVQFSSVVLFVESDCAVCNSE